MDLKTLAIIIAGMIFAFFIAFAATPVVRKIAVRAGAVDIPKDERRMHNKPIPTMGGLAIFIAFAFGTLAFVPLDKTYIAVLLGAAAVTLLGILDDIFCLKWWAKLIGQIGAALIVCRNGIIISGISIGTSHEVLFGYWSYGITILWIVAITNAINLLDGLDGLACGIIGISCTSLMIVASFYMEPRYSSVIVMIAILGGSCFGFLPYNLNPAKIFMGDTGAMLIGFVISVLSIQGFFKLNAIVAFGAPLLVLALPILDTLYAIIRRLIRKEHFFKPDKKHFHHKLIKCGFNQKQSVLIMYTMSAVLGLAAILVTWKRSLWLIALLIITAAVIILYIIIRRKIKLTRKKVNA